MQAGLRADQILRDVFGYPVFRGQQRDIVSHVAEGGDALVLMPTGAASLFAFRSLRFVRDGMGVVVSPLIALMHDQVAALEEAGVRAAALNSSMTWRMCSPSSAGRARANSTCSTLRLSAS